jgi:glycosyltransferase involved in cell wall biosynthesis
MRKFLRSVDVAIAMSADQLPLLLDKYPDIAPDRWRVAEHPHYRDAYADFRPREETRDRLGVPRSATLVVMLGLVRPYKGMEEAIGAFRAAARPDEFLLIAGHCDDAQLRLQLEQAAAGAPNIRLLFERLPDAELASCFKAADLALYNFTSILNSGSVIAALSLDCPVLAPHAVAFEEQKRRNPDWLDLFDQPLTPQRLRSRLDQVPLRQPAGSPNLDAQSVEAVGAAHRRIYAEALELAWGRTARAR